MDNETFIIQLKNKIRETIQPKEPYSEPYTNEWYQNFIEWCVLNELANIIQESQKSQESF